MSTLDGVLAHRARWSPGALAFHDGREALSYGALAADAAGLAGGLAHLGVRPDDRVALFLLPGLDFVRAFYALQQLGAAPCAFDPRSPAPLAARRAARLRPRLALTAGPATGDLATACAAVGLHALPLARVPSGLAAPPRPDPDGVAAAERAAYLQPTSGTSGEPRLAVLSHRNVLGLQRAAWQDLPPEVSKVLVGWAPPWHDLGLVRFLIGPVFLGSPCHLVEPAIRTLGTWLRTVSEVRGTLIGAPDFAYRLATRLVEPAGLDLSSLRYAIDGGEPVRASTIAAFEARFGVAGVIRPGYGLAEATLGVSCLRPGEPLRVDARGNVSCGRPLPGVEVRIEPPPGEPDAPGEILVRGVGVFAGYLDDDAASREALRGGWLHTGDIGRLDADSHLYVLARRRALLKRGGATLAPREIEEAAELVPGVRFVAAVARPHGEHGTSEAIVVVVEADSPAVTDSASDLAARVGAAVARTVGFVPDHVLVVAPRTIPRTPNGKVQHHLLQRDLRDLMEGRLAGGQQGTQQAETDLSRI